MLCVRDDRCGVEVNTNKRWVNNLDVKIISFFVI